MERLETLDLIDPDFIRIFVDYLADSDRKVRDSAEFAFARAIQAEVNYWLARVADPSYTEAGRAHTTGLDTPCQIR
jgi:hypothetical protein